MLHFLRTDSIKIKVFSISQPNVRIWHVSFSCQWILQIESTYPSISFITLRLIIFLLIFYPKAVKCSLIRNYFNEYATFERVLHEKIIISNWIFKNWHKIIPSIFMCSVVNNSENNKFLWTFSLFFLLLLDLIWQTQNIFTFNAHEKYNYEWVMWCEVISRVGINFVLFKFCDSYAKE